MRGNQIYVTIPGNQTHELPPLLVRSTPDPILPSEILDLAAAQAEEMLPEVDHEKNDFESRRMDLALTLAEQYRHLVSQWVWGDSILEWIRQCEITFEAEAVLRPLLHPDVWPHAGRSSFVTLLADKRVPTAGVPVQKAVGLRLTFRQPPPIDCFSNQFLFYLNTSVADSAYQKWVDLSAFDPALLPPERFHFEVVEINVH